MPAFSGKYYYTVDPKGRVMVPAPFREIVSANYSSKLYVTNAAFEKCLHLFPLEEWNNMQDKVRSLPRMDDSVNFFMKRVIASALEVEMDRQGRVLIPSTLREDSGISGEAVLVGQIDRIAIWERALWDEVTDISKVDVKSYKKALSDFGL
jgi:MraZ protein